MKINNPNKEYKKRHPKWTKVNHFDNDYFISTKWKKVEEFKLLSFTSLIHEDFEFKEKLQSRLPAYPSSRTDLYKNRKSLKEILIVMRYEG